MRIIGVDPGNAVTGFGVVERAQVLDYVAAGTVNMRGMSRGPQRLASLYQKLLELLDRYTPQAMSLERSFVAVNVQSAFALGEARAAAMLAAAHRELKVFEYTPTDVKLAIAGYGRAEKAQVKLMVQRTLRLPDDIQLTHDAADALALALCHVFRANFSAVATSPGTKGACTPSRIVMRTSQTPLLGSASAPPGVTLPHVKQWGRGRIRTERAT